MSRHRIRLDILLLFVAAAWLVTVLVVPDERTLGGMVKWVFIHAAMTQVSLLLFLAAALLAVGFLVRRSRLYVWMQTCGYVALGLWVAGFILSTIPARLTWGVWIDFAEPRTQMTLRVLGTGLLFVLVTKWVENRTFTAVAQILLSGLVLFLNNNTNVVRHPLNPIGEATNSTIPLAYSSLFLLTFLFCLLLIAWIVQRTQTSSTKDPITNLQ